MRIATIRENECIGCAKCLAACPFDAILGAAKFLHTVLNDECIGCELCVAPCPMDCIEMIDNPIGNEGSILDKTHRAQKAKTRYIARKKRMIQNQRPQLMDANHDPEFKQKIRDEIGLAIARVKARKDEQPKNSRDI